MPFFLVRFIVPETMTGLEVDPRSVMSNVVKRADEKGLSCMSGAEFEVSLVRRILLKLVLSIRRNAAQRCGQGICQSQAVDTRK